MAWSQSNHGCRRARERSPREGGPGLRSPDPPAVSSQLGHQESHVVSCRCRVCTADVQGCGQQEARGVGWPLDLEAEAEFNSSATQGPSPPAASHFSWDLGRESRVAVLLTAPLTTLSPRSRPGPALPRPSLTSWPRTHHSSASAAGTSLRSWSTETPTGGGADPAGAWASSRGATCRLCTCDQRAGRADGQSGQRAIPQELRSREKTWAPHPVSHRAQQKASE